MKKSHFAGMSAIAIGILLNYSVSYGSDPLVKAGMDGEKAIPSALFQDTASKKAKPTKKAEIDRTKGEAGRGQGKGVDTLPTTTGAERRTNRADMNRGTQDKTEQNSDNRGEGAGKNNRAGNSKKGVDTTRQ